MLISLQILTKTFVSNTIIDFHTICASLYSLKCLKTVWSRLFTSTHCSRLAYRLDRNGKLLKILRILITAVCFKDRNWISKSVYYISCSVVCKIVFCSEFPDIPYNAGKVKRGRIRTQVIAKRYAFHANAKTSHRRLEIWRWTVIIQLPRSLQRRNHCFNALDC